MKRYRPPQQLISILMKLSDLTARKQLLMGIWSISTVSALAEPDADIARSPDKPTWNTVFQSTESNLICNASLEFCIQVYKIRHISMFRPSGNIVKPVCCFIRINARTLREVRSNGTCGFRKAVSDFDIDDNMQKNYYLATSDEIDMT